MSHWRPWGDRYIVKVQNHRNECRAPSVFLTKFHKWSLLALQMYWCHHILHRLSPSFLQIQITSQLTNLRAHLRSFFHMSLWKWGLLRPQRAALMRFENCILCHCGHLHSNKWTIQSTAVNCSKWPAISSGLEVETVITSLDNMKHFVIYFQLHRQFLLLGRIGIASSVQQLQITKISISSFGIGGELQFKFRV